LGGLLAIGGAGLFVFNILRALRSDPGHPRAQPTRRDVRWNALALTLGLTVVLGVFLANLSTDSQGALVEKTFDPREDATGHAAQMRKAEVDRRFAKGVALLTAQQYELAASEFHRVLELAPQMPEAHVNMGFAMIGEQRFAISKDFFEVAIDLNKNQNNAYYGLAEALEGLRDFPGAIGAMRTYLHLNKVDNAYTVKASASIRKWETLLNKPATDNAEDSRTLTRSTDKKSVTAGGKRVAN
jgi:tetratricopeptide (TPR) repeat protein